MCAENFVKLAIEAVKSGIPKLNSYLEGNKDVGIENWFQVELVAKLREKDYTVEIRPILDGKRPDLRIKAKDAWRYVELKAGSYCGKCRRYTGQLRHGATKYNADESFVGCLFLGYFEDMEEDEIKQIVENGDAFTCQSLGQVGDRNSKWWVGLLRTR